MARGRREGIGRACSRGRGRALAGLAILLTGLVGIPLAAPGCSLGLDAARIGDAGAADGAFPGDTDGASSDGEGADGARPVSDGAMPPVDAATGCNGDADCKAQSPCLHGRCDVATHACLYDVCPQAKACASAACDTQAGTCSLPADYTFRPAQVTLPRGGLACAGNASVCVAAVWPFVFVGLQQGVIAYQVSDPANPAPPRFDVGGIPFLPRHMIASGRRVYFVGNVSGPQGAFRFPVAWIDVPGNPFVKELAAQSNLVAFSDPSIGAIFRGPGASLFVVNGDSGRFFPTALLDAPLAPVQKVDAFELAGIPLGGVPVSASGKRVVSHRFDGAASPATQTYFTLHGGAGTAATQASAELPATAMGASANQNAFAQGADGSVLWATATIGADDAGVVYPSVRASWLLEGGASPALDLAARAEIETYSPPLTGLPVLVGPLAWLDAKRALVTAAAHEDRAQASVQVLSREGSPATVLPDRRIVITQPPNALGVTASERMGYVLAPDGPDGFTLHVFAPGCPNPP